MKLEVAGRIIIPLYRESIVTVCILDWFLLLSIVVMDGCTLMLYNKRI